MNEFSASLERLTDIVPEMIGKRVLIVGDVMVDEYLTGEAERISPEAPVPVVRVIEDSHVIGGAGNVAMNIKHLGGEPTLVCATGTGSGAEQLDLLLNEDDIKHTFIKVPGRKTTIKTRIMASRQQMLRIDREDTSPLPEDALTSLIEFLRAEIENYDVMIVSDYGKGVVSSTFLQDLAALRSECAPHLKVLVDPKTPNFALYQGVFMLTPNAKETSEGAHLPVGNKEEIIAAGNAIFDMLGCANLLTTLGPKGMAVFQGQNDVVQIPTMAREVFDVTGAGDTVIATAALSLAAGHSLLDACVLANYAAGIVVGRVGASSVSQQELIDTIDSSPLPDLERWA